jgi:hypothetical protein
MTAAHWARLRDYLRRELERSRRASLAAVDDDARAAARERAGTLAAVSGRMSLICSAQRTRAMGQTRSAIKRAIDARRKAAVHAEN